MGCRVPFFLILPPCLLLHPAHPTLPATPASIPVFTPRRSWAIPSQPPARSYFTTQQDLSASGSWVFCNAPCCREGNRHAIAPISPGRPLQPNIPLLRLLRLSKFHNAPKEGDTSNGRGGDYWPFYFAPPRERDSRRKCTVSLSVNSQRPVRFVWIRTLLQLQGR